MSPRIELRSESLANGTVFGYFCCSLLDDEKATVPNKSSILNSFFAFVGLFDTLTLLLHERMTFLWVTSYGSDRKKRKERRKLSECCTAKDITRLSAFHN